MKKLSAFLLAALFVITAILFTSCKTLTSYQVFSEAIGDEESDVKADIKLENTKLSIVINGDGYISKYALSYDMTVNVVADGEESSVFASVTSEIEFINPGQPVEVTPPSDIDKYVSLEEATKSFY